MSQASSDFDDLDASGELESGVFDSTDLSADDFGSSVGFEEISGDALAGDDLTDGNVIAADGGQTAVAPTPFAHKKQGFSIYTLMLILSFISLTATAIIMFTYASSL
jgi:hypothetical protein